MPEKKLPSQATLARKVKDLEKQLSDMKELMWKREEKWNHERGQELAKHGNEQYGLGLEQGYRQAQFEFEASRKSQTFIDRLLGR